MGGNHGKGTLRSCVYVLFCFGSVHLGTCATRIENREQAALGIVITGGKRVHGKWETATGTDTDNSTNGVWARVYFLLTP